MTQFSPGSFIGRDGSWTHWFKCNTELMLCWCL